MMYIPFFGHIISGSLMLVNVYMVDWDPRYLFLEQAYIPFGGYTLLSIAM